MERKTFGKTPEGWGKTVAPKLTKAKAAEAVATEERENPRKAGIRKKIEEMKKALLDSRKKDYVEKIKN